jgi:hypothetical protein
MQRILTCLIALILLGCNGTRYQWFDGTLEEAKALAGSKLILLDFYTYT